MAGSTAMRRGPPGGGDVAVADRSANDGGGAAGASSTATSRPLGRCTARWGPSCCACTMLTLHCGMEYSFLQTTGISIQGSKLGVEVINANRQQHPVPPPCSVPDAEPWGARLGAEDREQTASINQPRRSAIPVSSGGGHRCCLQPRQVQGDVSMHHHLQAATTTGAGAPAAGGPPAAAPEGAGTLQARRTGPGAGAAQV